MSAVLATFTYEPQTRRHTGRRRVAVIGRSTMTDETIEQATPPAATIPQPLANYLARLVNGAKLTYVSALVAHLYGGAARPEMPNAEWAPKALAKVEKYSGRKVKR